MLLNQKKDIKQFVLYCAASNRLIIYRIKSKKFKLKQIDIKFDYKEFMHRLSNYENYGRPYWLNYCKGAGPMWGKGVTIGTIGQPFLCIGRSGRREEMKQVEWY